MPEAAATITTDIEALSAHSDESWELAMLAARVFAIAGGRIGGIHLRARSSAARADYLNHLGALRGGKRPWIKITPGTGIDRLVDSLDIATTAKLGRPVRQSGILEQVQDGTLLIGLCERLEAGQAAIISDAMDRPDTGKFAIIASDEGLDESEGIPPSLKDRLGLFVDLNGAQWRGELFDPSSEGLPSWQQCEAVDTPEKVSGFLATLLLAIGNTSMRALFQLCDIARALAAMEGEASVTSANALVAFRLRFGFVPQLGEPTPPEETTQKTNPPPAEQSRQPEQAEENNEKSPDNDEQQKLIDLEALLDIAVKTGSADAITGLDLRANGNAMASRSSGGKSGASRSGDRRGRTIGFAATPPYTDARPDVPATIRTAAPWQKLRNSILPDTDSGRLRILGSDFRYRRYRQPARSTAIFAVDASGSTALERLAETKGAIELLLASCYVRRDEVALITFRGTNAEMILEPTRSLVRAKRTLGEMAGGGPTPLADATRLSFQTAMNVRRQGATPILIFLTDGSGNITLSGDADRQIARRDTEAMAMQIRAAGIKAICIDIARRPQESVRDLAAKMGADYHRLPMANASGVSQLVSAYMEGGER